MNNALTNLKDLSPEAQARLVSMVTSEQSSLQERWFAVMALTKLQGKKIYPKLVEWASHKDWMIRLGSLKALGYLNLEKPLPLGVVLGKLKDPAILVRDGALETLGRWCSEESKTAILNMLDDPDHFRKKHPLFIRRRAVEVLGRCRFQTPDVTARLLRLFQEKDFYDLHKATHEALVKLTDRKHAFRAQARYLSRVWGETLQSLGRGPRLSADRVSL